MIPDRCKLLLKRMIFTMVDYKLYEVGGHVRDSILGIKSADIDYTVVMTNPEKFSTALEAFETFEKDIEERGFKVFVSKPEVFTIRSKFPNSNEIADFVLARKESGFQDGTRLPQDVELGSLEDDLRRRDFTVNAMAFDSDGVLVDPFGGEKDLAAGILRTPVSPDVSFNDDPLRILRGLRFSVTKGFKLSSEVWDAIATFDTDRFATVSKERVMEELKKMFMTDTVGSLMITHRLKTENHALWSLIFKGTGIRLEPTLKQ